MCIFISWPELAFLLGTDGIQSITSSVWTAKCNMYLFNNEFSWQCPGYYLATEWYLCLQMVKSHSKLIYFVARDRRSKQRVEPADFVLWWNEAPFTVLEATVTPSAVPVMVNVNREQPFHTEIKLWILSRMCAPNVQKNFWRFMCTQSYQDCIHHGSHMPRW